MSAFSVIVPTLNAASEWPAFSRALLACVEPKQILIVDSSSNDNTAELARQAGFRVLEIARSEFNHGGTRQWAAEQVSDKVEFLVYLTQDAILASPDAIANILAPFGDPQVAAVCGRQLPHIGAGPIESHARLFNYPEHSSVRTLESRKTMGFKAIFISNSFAAYRRSALMAAGGFPTNVIFGEDTVLVARLLLGGWKVAYAGDACVRHSHAYSIASEFKRYFDIGVLHHRESWLLEEFGQASGEGKRFVLSELRYLLKRNPLLIPGALLRTGAKLAGYRLGRSESRLSVATKRRLSMHHRFWQGE
ncbi:glycosyltransferase [Silvibacterium sp.]|uniref:glycosyltransferase n=1 Tax=Silvibacterium sp. TaxID=1964179 RepID=UPI0039E643E4